MPLIAVNLSDKILVEVRELIEKGRYTSLEAFIEIGAFNQLALERGASPDEIIERGHRRKPSDDTAPSPRVVRKTTKQRASSNGAVKEAVVGKITRVDILGPITDDDAKAVFARFQWPVDSAIPAAVSMPKRALTGEHIFGQVNRLLPVKFVCRWLANSAANNGQWPKYTAIAAKLADDAGTIGSLLDEWDNAQQRNRGSELATALPRRKNNASLDRFLSQFVARITRASEISPGAACQYEFVKFDDSAVVLTQQGLEFAKLTNPILDAQDKASTSALSEAESEFLASHIRMWVPTEWEDMTAVLMAIQSGKTSPSEVSTDVRAKLPETWTESMVQTHVSGVIARLGDIRLLRRSWQGRNVRYETANADYINAFLRNSNEGRP